MGFFNLNARKPEASIMAMSQVVDLKRLNVPQLAQHHACIEGQIPLSELERVVEGLQSPETERGPQEPSKEPGREEDLSAPLAFAGSSSAVEWSMAFFQSELPPLSAQPKLPNQQPHGSSLGSLLSREHPSLSLKASACLELICQRCLAPMEAWVHVDRQFFWVPNEAAAMALDDVLEEDVLVSSASFDGQTLIEDELIMAMPLVPMHEACPVVLSQHHGATPDDDLLSIRPNPFAVLSSLKVKKS
jgi:uncharacterized protein